MPTVCASAFQSTPSPGGDRDDRVGRDGAVGEVSIHSVPRGGQRLALTQAAGHASFQSTPSPGGDRDEGRDDEGFICDVSIHSVPRGGQRQPPRRHQVVGIKFQSTPSPGGDRDGYSMRYNTAWFSFQSTPSPGGDRDSTMTLRLRRRAVSIHSVPRGGQRPPVLARGMLSKKFQSTPSPGGDRDPGCPAVAAIP